MDSAEMLSTQEDIPCLPTSQLTPKGIELKTQFYSSMEVDEDTNSVEKEISTASYENEEQKELFFKLVSRMTHLKCLA